MADSEWVDAVRVVVLAPVTADVTIAQITTWLERNGWRRDPRGIHSPHFDGWSKGDGLIGVVKPYAEEWEDVGSATGQYTIGRIAMFEHRHVADILREMSEVVL